MLNKDEQFEIAHYAFYKKLMKDCKKCEDEDDTVYLIKLDIPQENNISIVGVHESDLENE